mmetsp:Transcript_93830/g.265414  ORF Transcript_93830/g.265414 Transcript_93830/m.265414 type:complete len:208 (+) Transcript_93830:914-1537(+)
MPPLCQQALPNWDSAMASTPWETGVPCSVPVCAQVRRCGPQHRPLGWRARKIPRQTTSNVAQWQGPGSPCPMHRAASLGHPGQCRCRQALAGPCRRARALCPRRAMAPQPPQPEMCNHPGEHCVLGRRSLGGTRCRPQGRARNNPKAKFLCQVQHATPAGFARCLPHPFRGCGMPSLLADGMAGNQPVVLSIAFGCRQPLVSAGRMC